jgi:spermidine synthase
MAPCEDSARRDALAPLLMAGLFATGATALAAEVTYSRLLRYVFGNTHAATATVLAAYMAGLSAGSYMFGRFVPRVVRRVAAYGFVELLVGALYVLTPGAYLVLRDAWLTTAGGLGLAGPGQLAVGFALSFAFVALPTFFMGGTLPLLVAALGAQGALSKDLPRFYAANTFGAAVGTLLTGYLLLDTLGIDGTLSLCAVVNLVVGVAALAVSRRFGATLPASAGGEPLERGHASPDSWPSRAIVLLAFAQGAIAFSLEVVWTHLIGTAIGVTTFAFAVMLSAILIGIGVGSSFAPALRRGLGLSPQRAFLASTAAMGLLVAVTLPLWDRFPTVINVSLAFGANWGFAARELVRLAFCMVVMLPVTVCLGLALPSLAAAASHVDAGRVVGMTFAANTLGAIGGSLFTGFALLGRVRSETLLTGCALLACTVAFSASRLERAPLSRPLRLLMLASAAAGLAALAFPGWDQPRLTSGTHYYWTAWPPVEPAPSIVFFSEDAQSGFVTVEHRPSGIVTMKTNGKYESRTGAGEFQDFLAIVGGAYLSRFDSAFLLGLGGGRTLGLLHEMPFRRIEVAEYSPAILRAAREQFASVSGSALRDPRVRVHVDDGRNRLQLNPARYDLVIVAISGAAFAGSGSIYNRDFFELVRSRLAPGGVFLLWQQLHHVREQETRSALHTLLRVFPHVHFYATPSGTQGYTLASAEPLALRQSAASLIGTLARSRQTLKAVDMEDVRELVAWSIFADDAALAAYLDAGPRVLFTDMYPAWEFRAPRGLALKIAGLRLSPWRSRGLPAFDPPLESADLAWLSALRELAIGDPASGAAWLARAEALGPESRTRRIQALREKLAVPASVGPNQ